MASYKKHLVPCPTCQKDVLDHMEVCPFCKAQISPKSPGSGLDKAQLRRWKIILNVVGFAVAAAVILWRLLR